MLVKCIRATAPFRRAQEFFPHSFQPPQAKLRTWPSLIRDRCAPQARHAHTFSDVKEVENAKYNIKEGVKKDLVLYLLSLWSICYFSACSSNLHLDNARPLGRSSLLLLLALAYTYLISASPNGTTVGMRRFSLILLNTVPVQNLVLRRKS